GGEGDGMVALAEPAQLMERGPHPATIRMDERLVEQQRRRLSVPADDPRERDALQEIDQGSGPKAEVVDVLEGAILGLDLQRQIIPDANVPVAPIGDRRQLVLELRLQTRDHGTPDRL